jgi:hypothetical protein
VKFPDRCGAANTGVVGQRLDRYEIKTAEDSTQVVFVFDGGVSIIVNNENDRSNYRIAERLLHHPLQ